MNYMRKTNASSSSIGPDKGKVRMYQGFVLKGKLRKTALPDIFKGIAHFLSN